MTDGGPLLKELIIGERHDDDVTIDETADRFLVQDTAHAMGVKLAIKRNDGRGGWYLAKFTDEELHALILDHVKRENWLDVVNLAAMASCRRKYGTLSWQDVESLCDD